MSPLAKKIVKILMILLLLGALLYAGARYLLEEYKITEVYVEGNEHYTAAQIEEIVCSGLFGNNSLYLSLKYRNKGVEDVAFVDVMDVSILSSHTIKITVYEKSLAGYIKYLDAYVYFDKDGYVVECSSIKTEGVPQITGLSFDSVVLGEQLQVEDESVFTKIMTITNLLNKYALDVDKIYFHTDGSLTLYFDDIKVYLGSDYDDLEDKFMLLPEFLEKLEGMSGTVDMEKSPSETEQFVFKPD